MLPPTLTLYVILSMVGRVWIDIVRWVFPCPLSWSSRSKRCIYTSSVPCLASATSRNRHRKIWSRCSNSCLQTYKELDAMNKALKLAAQHSKQKKAKENNQEAEWPVCPEIGPSRHHNPDLTNIVWPPTSITTTSRLVLETHFQTVGHLKISNLSLTLDGLLVTIENRMR